MEQFTKTKEIDKQRERGIEMDMRTRRSTAIQYENFQPKFEWVEEEGANVLLIYLPDYLKEQLKITYVHSSRMVQVTGERPLTYNQWSRFNQNFRVPQNCEVNKIQGKFKNEILYITMPKPTIKQPHPKEEAKATKEDPLPSKDASVEKPMTSQVPQKPTMEPKQTDEKKPGVLSPPEASKDQKSQKGQAETPPEAASTSDTVKQKDEKPITGKKESTAEVSKKPAESFEEKTLFEQEESIKKRKESDNASLKALEKDKGKGVKLAGSGSEEKQKQDFKIAGKVKEVKNVAATAAKKTVKGLNAIELSEERQKSMVNIGVAALVIVALGAYLAYSYQSSRTSTD
ncbi:unnamed protein product [Dovyalis caffra]|uniref:SHSP domain-containing protein n=1 Tax=Dovyalis caffra TaxID=77055 RepID=A0AAV1QWG0_9ROSI|nr:unnamed protein product [Dovyalis caffra]